MKPIDVINENYPGLLIADGFDDAIIGVVGRCGMEDVVLYDTEKCIEILESQGMSLEEANEYFYYNIIGSFVGEYTPCFAKIF